MFDDAVSGITWKGIYCWSVLGTAIVLLSASDPCCMSIIRSRQGPFWVLPCIGLSFPHVKSCLWGKSHGLSVSIADNGSNFDSPVPQY
eukprot:6486129-Amphidinium_carterae.1